jgi:hypothetical protein
MQKNVSSPTVVIQISNANDLLSQEKWSAYVRDMNHAIRSACRTVFSFAASEGHAPQQHAIWIVEPFDPDRLKNDVRDLREHYKSFGAAWIQGETQYV